jgi:hypothetical protein
MLWPSRSRSRGRKSAGYLEGRVALGDTSNSTDGERSPSAAPLVTVRRVDGDGNGLFTDPHDRLWIDLNGDGAWDAVNEQFLFATVLSVDGIRYAVRSDEQANHLTLAKLEGTGTIKLAIRESAHDSSVGRAALGHIVEIAVTMQTPDGSVVRLDGRPSVNTASLP